MNAPARRLILHADDLGLSSSVNRATFEALERGWVTSASVMVPCAAFDEVPARAGTFDIGIHLTLTCEVATRRWGPVADPRDVPSLVAQDGCFFPDAETVMRTADPRDVEIEVRAQIACAREAGLAPTHLDSHMFVLCRSASLAAVLDRVARDCGLPAVNPFRRAADPDTPWTPRLALASLIDHDAPIEAVRARAARVPAGLSTCLVHCGDDDDELRAMVGTGAYGAAWRRRDFDALAAGIAAAVTAAGIEVTDWRRETARRRAIAGPATGMDAAAS